MAYCGQTMSATKPVDPTGSVFYVLFLGTHPVTISVHAVSSECEDHSAKKSVVYYENHYTVISPFFLIKFHLDGFSFFPYKTSMQQKRHFPDLNTNDNPDSW